MPMWSLCAQLCSRIKVCKSINFIALNNTCQINDAEPTGNEDGLIESVGNSFIAASSLPKEVAGPCKGHDCNGTEVCISQSPTYACVNMLEIFFERRTREGSIVSQFKKTGQSTLYDCEYGFACGAEKGVDGIKEPKSMFHTRMKLEPFWWVNLGQVYKVQKVISTNRMDNYGHRLTKMLLHVGNSLDTSRMNVCGQFIGPAVNGQVIVIRCYTLPEGQIVKLTSFHTAPEFFHLAEVEVYAV
ncbi:fucolectin-4-like [Mytilus trossulus]|uniref:fucolectin-4-like n=1 Tax=Mytilus trossulus TaxID=6551 RepID=UPI0030055DBE